MMNASLNVRHLGQQDYQSVWQGMREFTDTRTPETEDEIWFVQHPPIFTLGQSGKREHILQTTNIPIIQTDRGGQVTYHGPGQLIAYVLIDIKRKNLGVRRFVTLLEQSVVNLLSEFNISSNTRCSAPGVYVDEKKICSVGLRIRRGCSYHGLALNVDMDLTPFQLINPCGFPNLQVTQIKDYYSPIDFNHLCAFLVDIMSAQFSKSQS